MNRTMDYKVGTADGQSEGLQVLGIGEPWSIYFEGIEECYLLVPLVIRGLSHSVNLGIMSLKKVVWGLCPADLQESAEGSDNLRIIPMVGQEFCDALS